MTPLLSVLTAHPTGNRGATLGGLRAQRSVAAVVSVVVPSVDRSIPGPVGASALDSRARESPALVLGGRLGRGPRGHGLVVHQLDTRGRRDVPHVRVSDSTEPIDIRRRNGPVRYRDGRGSKMSTSFLTSQSENFGKPDAAEHAVARASPDRPKKKDRFRVTWGTRGTDRNARRRKVLVL